MSKFGALSSSRGVPTQDGRAVVCYSDVLAGGGTRTSLGCSDDVSVQLELLEALSCVGGVARG